MRIIKNYYWEFLNAIPRSQEDEKRWVPSYPLPQLPRSPLSLKVHVKIIFFCIRSCLFSLPPHLYKTKNKK